MSTEQDMVQGLVAVCPAVSPAQDVVQPLMVVLSCTAISLLFTMSRLHFRPIFSAKDCVALA